MAVVGALAGGPVDAWSQDATDQAPDSRQAEWAARQARKAADLHPDTPTRLERAIARLTAPFVSERPMFLFLGGVMEGGGAALGPGYRVRFGDSGLFQAHAARSWKGQTGAEATAQLPVVARGRVRPTVSAAWVDAPDVRFHGVGADSSTANDLAYDYRSVSGGAGLHAQPWSALTVGGEAGVLSVTSAFRNRGLAPQPDVDRTYMESRLFAVLETRRAPRYLARGGSYRVDVIDYRGNGPHDFQRREAEVQQYLPLLRNNWTLALRALATTTVTSAGHEVPYSLLPALGGRSLRGYRAWRYRDRARVMTTGEFRWAAGPHVEMAVFMDAGTVAPRLADVTARAFETTQGVGLIVHTPQRGVARFDVARSREGYAMHFTLGPTF